ncbi:hypothetical protein OCU04_007464 [Sclerotinia nivalis]|uniref:Uncharacterized protein n=1 Tax=Sclerotinia nivalis TaxID=352851 RepID=A0A9X0AJ25_9HELO|nr:hypothetical protein OCU04_007464 [Sclerotinia nivalis]
MIFRSFNLSVIPSVKNNRLGPLGVHQSRIPSARSPDQPSTTPTLSILPTAGRTSVHSSSKAKPQKYLLTFSSVILLARPDKPLLCSISASTRSLGLSENFPLHKAFISAVTSDGPKASSQSIMLVMYSCFSTRVTFLTTI